MNKYHEGPEAKKRFEEKMSKLLKTPKESLKDKQIPKQKIGVRKPREA
jgi:hypothetical protein